MTDLEARPDGLYGRFKWAPTGRELLDNAHYKFFSPRWLMTVSRDGTFEPVRLLSIGLTNTPNIPGDAIANDRTGAGERPGAPGAIGAVPVDASASTGEAAAPAEDALGIATRAAPPAASNEPAPPPALLLNTVSRTAGLGTRRCGGRAAAIVAAVNSRMAGTGEDFATAWANLRRIQPELFL